MKKILLCGNSIFIAGLAASLRATPNVEVVQLSDPKDLGDPSGLPNLVIVDMANWSSPLTQWCVQRNLLLVGVDTASGTLTVLSGKSLPAYSVEEVLNWLTNLCSASNSHRA